jgi:hypothetical protein
LKNLAEFIYTVLFFLALDKAGILNKPDIKSIIKGYNNNKKKLIIVSYFI